MFCSTEWFQQLQEFVIFVFFSRIITSAILLKQQEAVATACTWGFNIFAKFFCR